MHGTSIQGTLGYQALVALMQTRTVVFLDHMQSIFTTSAIHPYQIINKQSQKRLELMVSQAENST